MVRISILKAEFVLLAGLQALGAVAALMGIAPALAQSDRPSSDPPIAADFMAALPPSDPPKAFPRERPADQQLYYRQPSAIAAYRFYSNRKRISADLKAILDGAESAFARECADKGGRVEGEGAPANFQSQFRFTVSPGATARFCTHADGRSLGALVIEQTRVTPDSSDIFVISLLSKDRITATIAVVRPDGIISPADLAAEEARRRDDELRRDQARQAERTEAERWRRTIVPGIETGCGPVLRVNGELVEVVYFRTREPKWYRRNELWPRMRDIDGRPTCQ